MNVVEFAIKMRDGASSVLGDVGKKWMHVQENCSAATKEVKRHEQATSGMAASIKKMLSGAALMAAAYKAGELIKDSIQQSLDRQKLQVSFDVLTGSKEAGGALTKQLVELQKNTILGGEVFEGAQTLLSFGIDQSKVTDTLRMIGDISMGDAEKFKSLTLAFSQMSSTGKLMGQDLLQMINAGFNPLNEIARKTGKSVGALKDDMAKGAISAQMVEDAFRSATSEGGQFNNMLGQIAETSAGKMAQLQGAWTETRIKIGEALEPLLRFGLDIANRLLPVIEAIAAKITPAAEMIAGKMGEMRERFSGLMDYVSILRESLSGSILPTLMSIYQMIYATIGDVVELISRSEGIKATLRFLLWCVEKVFDLVELTIGALREAWRTVVKPILDALQKTVQFVKGIGGKKSAPTKAAAQTAAQTTSKTAAQTQTQLQEIAKNTRANAEAATAANKEVAGSGPKVVNVNVQKFFDTIQFNTTNLQESAGKIEETVLEVLSRVLVQGATQSV